MRFHKSVTIAKGVKLNFSKSGVRLGVGIPGCSVSFGKNGTYLNTGIPGTGISQRTKISGTTGNRNAGYINSQQSRQEIRSFKLAIDPKGNIEITDPQGNFITDPYVINKIKRSDQYVKAKAGLIKTMTEKVADMVLEHNTNNSNVINVVKFSEIVGDEHYYIDYKAKILNDVYIPGHFYIEKPDQSGAINALQQKAEKEITGWNVIAISIKRKKYVEDNLSSEYEKMLNEWTAQKDAFDQQETLRKKEFEDKQEHIAEYIDRLIAGDEQAISDEINGMLCNVEMPFDFKVSYEIKSSNCVMADLELPGIDKIPNDVAVQNKSGTLSIKKKTMADLRMDYVQCVFGYAIVFASKFFAVSPKINNVVMSGYTRRRQTNGKLADEYIYSMVFNRDQFTDSDLKHVSPYSFCMETINSCNLQSNGELKRVEPYTFDEIIDKKIISLREETSSNVDKPRTDSEYNPDGADNIVAEADDQEQLIKDVNVPDKNSINKKSQRWDKTSFLEQVSYVGGETAHKISEKLICFAENNSIKYRYGTGVKLGSFITELFAIYVYGENPGDKIVIQHRINKLAVKNRLGQKRVVEMFEQFASNMNLSDEAIVFNDDYINIPIKTLSDEEVFNEYINVLTSIDAIHKRAKKK